MSYISFCFRDKKLSSFIFLGQFFDGCDSITLQYYNVIIV